MGFKVKKEFAVKAAGAATLEIKRTRYGSRPKGEPEFKFSVTDAAGKEIFTSKDSVKVSKTWQVQLPGAGNYNIKIHDS